MPAAEKDIMQQPLLTIAIPTFNRALKLKRLLNIIQEQIVASNLQACVYVLVSDNASTDQTPAVASEFTGTGFNFTYYRQPQNLGFDDNLRFLYAHAKSRYVWFVADDDFPLKGAIGKLVNILEAHDPDVLLFSFVQPPGSTVRQFDFPEPVRVVSDPVSAIGHTMRYTKLSIYVLRKVEFDDAHWRILDDNLGTGWYFISLAFSVLEASQDLRLAAVSEPLASCDEEYVRLPWVPAAFLRWHKPVQHPFVMKHSPNLPKSYYDQGYYVAIGLAFASKTGDIVPEHPEDYDKFIKELECRIPALLRRPRTLAQFIALKLRIAHLWPVIESTMQRVRTLPALRQRRQVMWSNREPLTALNGRGGDTVFRTFGRGLAIARHHAYRVERRVSTWWRVREIGVRGRAPLTFEERQFYLHLRCALAGDNLVVYDIGASTGVFCGCLAKLINVRAVHAFEPIPSVFSELVERVQPYSQVVCYNVALGDTNAKMTIHVDRSSDSSSLLEMMQLCRDEFPGTGDTHPEEVTVVRLDDFVRERGLPQPDVIKIDVQSYEDRVLRGGMQTVSRAKYCVLEMSLCSLYEASPLFDDIYCLMRDMGFRLIGLAGTLLGKSGCQLQVDGIFENKRIHRDALPKSC